GQVPLQGERPVHALPAGLPAQRTLPEIRPGPPNFPRNPAAQATAKAAGRLMDDERRAGPFLSAKDRAPSIVQLCGTPQAIIETRFGLHLGHTGIAQIDVGVVRRQIGQLEDAAPTGLDLEIFPRTVEVCPAVPGGLEVDPVRTDLALQDAA